MDSLTLRSGSIVVVCRDSAGLLTLRWVSGPGADLLTRVHGSLHLSIPDPDRPRASGRGCPPAAPRLPSVHGEGK